MSTDTPFTDKLVQVWDSEMGDRQLSELSSKDLYAIEAILWGMHQDVVMEWSRRQMRNMDPDR